MWSLYQQSKEYGQRPSAILGIDPDCEYLCWCVDDAVLYFGRWVDGKLSIKHQKGPSKGKQMYSLQKILDPTFVDRQQSRSLLGLIAMGGHYVGEAHG